MIHPKYIVLFMLMHLSFIGAQDIEYSVFSIPEELKQNANSVIREAHTEITVLGQQKMTISTVRVVTILNESGYKNLQTTFYYNKYATIKSISGAIYNAYGTKLSRITKASFRDKSANDKYPVFKNIGMLELKYTPVEYPFTIALEHTVESSNTAVIPDWLLIEHYNESIEETSLVFRSASDIGFKWFEENFSQKYTIEKKNEADKIIYFASKVAAINPELSAPHLSNIVPKIVFSVEHFSLEGEVGTATNMKELGDWYFTSFLDGNDKLSKETKAKILTLVDTVKTPLEKAKLVYQFVQKHTRCVDMPLGVGGWRPAEAKDVAKIGYGDAKSLVNYTKALLDFVEIPSYYTLVYADEQGKRDIEHKYVRLQGNHVILQVPIKGKDYWLECSSFVSPFGLQCGHSDGRNVFVIKPEASAIVTTGAFGTSQNKRKTTGRYQITSEGDISGELKVVSCGSEYEHVFFLERRSEPKRLTYYKTRYANLNDLTVDSMTVANNRDLFEFTETFKFKAKRFGKIVNNDLTFSLNAFSQYPLMYEKNKNRAYPVEILLGRTYVDEILIDFPEGYAVQGELLNFDVDTKYGTYKTEVATVSDQTISYKREFVLHSGQYDVAEYEDFRLFLEQVMRNDVSKIELVERKE
ncbi:MAG: hypothetical protein H6584_01735 [Flavobacteriales bacterium]|nr:hypothetical protein [Flavobacteriales bacterium]